MNQSEYNFEIEWWPIDRPKDYPQNARKWSAKAVQKVSSSIREYGWRQPIVVDTAEVIAIGHLRRAAGREAGMKECPVHIARNLTPEQIRGLRLADNRTHEEAGWDFELLGAELIDLRRLGFGLELTGFDEQELARAMTQKTDGLTEPDECPPVPDAPVSKLGDLWVLGEPKGHRVLCGDATSVEATERLCAGQKIDLVFCDSPYNVDYEGYTKDRLKIQGDRMNREQFRHFLEAAFVSHRAVIKPGASLYICHSSSWQREFQDALEAAGFEVRCQIIWAKNTFAWGFGRYKFQHEPIFYCHLAGHSDAWYGDKSQSTLWQENKPAANRLHPTMKPIELLDRSLANSSKAGDLVLDLFGGSGSTVIACQRASRICLTMEIDPKYVDVIVTRWMQFSGEQAIHEETGATFEQVKQSRRLAIPDAITEESLETSAQRPQD
jgi:DNA modification methylase